MNVYIHSLFLYSFLSACLKLTKGQFDKFLKK